MYTTPRKVKQESRLRRSLSMTNTNQSTSPNLIGDLELSPVQAYAQAQAQAAQVSETGPTTASVPETTELIFCEETTPSSSSFLLHQHHLLVTPAVESPLPVSSNISSHNQAAALSASSALSSALNHFEHHPPPYRDPPVAGGIYSNQNHNSSNSRLSLVGVGVGGEPQQPQPPTHQHQNQQHQEKDWNSFQSKSGASGQELRSPVPTVRHSRTPSNSSEVYQTHSSKFPIVKEVILSQTNTNGGVEPAGLSGSAQSLSNSTPSIVNSKSQPQSASSSYNKKLPTTLVNSASSLKSQLPFVGWTADDNRKAYTLDGRSAKKVQDKLCSTVNSPSQRFTRRNSLDLEKFIQVFNEEQILMASMHGHGHGLQASTGSLGGIDNPALDLNGSHSNISPGSAMYNGNASGSKASSYYSSDSANSTSNSSQSQSLSSSNTDSLDTVIFKGPPPVGSIRDWQHQQRASMDLSMEHHHAPLDFNHSRSNSRTSENNAYRDTTNNGNLAASDGQPYQIPPSQASPYQPHYNSSNNYPMEYRPAQHHAQQMHHHHQQQQPPHTQLPLIQSSNLRNGQHPSAYHHQHQQSLLGSNPQLPTKSPLLSQKQFSSTDGLLDKAKEANSKQFSGATAKTYNHIKDMISSRFGPSMNQHSNKNSGMSGGVLNNNANSYNGHGAHAYNNSIDMADIGLPTTSYGAHLQSSHHHPQQQQHQQPNGHQPYHNHNSPPYYATPQPLSPYNGNLPTNGNQTSNSYLKSPSMNNDRKNVNTSFRKAIQKSTQKSNLVEDSLQMRTIHESPANLSANANSMQPQDHFQHQHQQQQATVIAEQRAQRALDKLLCDGGIGLGQAPNTQPQQQFRSHPQQQTQQGMSGFETSLKQPPPYPEKAPHTPQHHPQHSILRNPGSNTFSIKPPIGASTPGAHYSKPPAQRPVDEPPPLPTTKTTSVQDVRDSGDGSAAEPKNTIEGQKLSPNSAKTEQLKQMTTDLQNLALSVVVGMNGSGETQSSGSEGDMKGSQRVGSGQSHDSGVGTINSCKASPPPVLSSGGSEPLLLEGHKFSNVAGSNSSGNDSEWVDIVEPEIKQIIEMQRGSKPNGPTAKNPSTSTNAQQHHQDGGAGSSGTQTLKTIQSPKVPKKSDLTIHSKKSNHAAGPSSSHGPSTTAITGQSSNVNASNSNTWNAARPRLEKANAKSATMSRNTAAKELTFTKSGKLTRSAMNQILYSLNDDGGDITSTTTGGLDVESMLDGPTENTSDDDDDLSTTIDTTDAHAIRRQLESLETMYTEVLKVLGAKKFGGAMGPRYPGQPDLRGLRRRPYGSMSSLPSSVSSRPFKETKRRFDEKRKVKDIKSINRRFQRLESHVVTLARSVAHLSSEMRTQHLMVQEMESIRNELSQLRTQILKMPVHNPNQPSAGQTAAMAMAQQGQKVVGRQGGHVVNTTDWTSFRNALPSLTNPCRVRKLTKFFGDEPPLIRIFLKKLGYEKYAIHFEQERIGIMELPYLTEERLQKMGIPMGPRLRILQEAHMCLKPGAHFTVEHPLHNGNGNLSVYVV